VTSEHYDALVVGAGPAGSVAALVLARGGARVALVDKARFPRDKACGDLVGPRGVQTLADLGIRLDGSKVGDMEVFGPTGRRVMLRARPGVTYPGYAIVARRHRMDAALHEYAVAAGAAPFTGRAARPLFSDGGGLRGFEIDTDKAQPLRLTADTVIGADGALSRVGAAAGLVNEEKVLWAFAVRAYLEEGPRLPRIHFWEPSPNSGYPGYGWVFPGEGGGANVGLGVGARGDRRPGARASRDLAPFLAAAGVDPSKVGRTLGGWIKMGMVGTVPARDRTLLVGDAAGLVNPLQGEGIAQALGSGRAAADAVLAAGAGGAAEIYTRELARMYAPYAATTAPVTAWMIDRPRVEARLSRLLTAPGVGRLVAGGWALYWNDLLDGAEPGWPRRVARLAAGVGRIVTARSADRRAVTDSVTGPVSERAAAPIAAGTS
jgi:geranylgeranyl reductase family protein